MELVLEPGPLLQLSGLLRGMGLTDPPDVRVQYALLRAFGVAAAKARAMIASKPGQVAEVLLRACHLRATDPSAIKRSWAGWIIHHVEHDTSFEGEVSFQRWRRTALARLDQLGGMVERTAPSASPPAATPPANAPLRAVPLPPRPPAHPEAADHWESALDDLRPHLTMLDTFGVEDGVPVAIEGSTLVVVTSNDVAAKALQRLAPRIEEALAGRKEGPATVRIMCAPGWSPDGDTSSA